MEKLITPRRKQHTVLQDVDVTMIRPWSINPYTPVHNVRYSGQNNVDLNSP